MDAALKTTCLWELRVGNFSLCVSLCACVSLSLEQYDLESHCCYGSFTMLFAVLRETRAESQMTPCSLYIIVHFWLGPGQK